MLSGITGAFHELPKAWFWDEKSLGSIKNSNRLSQKSVRTRRNRRRLSDSDFHCVFDAKRCGKPWKHGIFGVLAFAVIFRQIPPGSVLATWLEIMMPLEGRGFESLRLRHKKHRSSVRITVFFCSISLNINSRGVIQKIRVYDICKWLIIFTPFLLSVKKTQSINTN